MRMIYKNCLISGQVGTYPYVKMELFIMPRIESRIVLCSTQIYHCNGSLTDCAHIARVHPTFNVAD